MIDCANFTPVTALAGGALIGLAAALLYALNGRILGASGIAGHIAEHAVPAVFDASHRDGLGWRLAFLIGVVGGPVGYFAFAGHLPEAVFIASDWRLALAGLIVGIGTGIGSGCTSGHGICGLARFSRRSLVAVVIFMATGFATTFLLNHGW